MNETSLDKIYTAGEAAERLRLTVRGTIKLGRKHGACSRKGRAYLFSESDLLALWQAMREPAKEPRALAVEAMLSDYRLQKSLAELTKRGKQSASPKVRQLVLSRSKRPYAKKLLEAEGGGDD